MTGGRVLVVDDDPELRESVVRLLEDEGYAVDHAVDGVDALARIHEQRPDAIVLDVLLPRMNGKQLLQALKRSELTSRIPVVVMTAVSGMTPHHGQVDAMFLVEKPFNVDELLNKVALAVYRAGGLASGEALGTAGSDRGLVLIVSPDHGFVERVDRELAVGDVAPLAITRGAGDLGRLARVLAPRAVILDLSSRRDEGVRTLEALRAEPGLEALRVLACSPDPGSLGACLHRLLELGAEIVTQEQIADRVLRGA